jgi:hypothetical protein
MLAVIDHQERIAIDLRCLDPMRSHAKRLGDLGFDPFRVHRSKLHKPYTVTVATEPTVTQLESRSRLAGTAHPMHGHQAGLVQQPIELV